MGKLDWDEVIPHVSDEFHKSVEASLDELYETKERRYMSKKYRLVLIAAAIMVFGTLTVSAATLLKWNDKVAEEFEANEEQQNNLISQGVAEIFEAELDGVSASDNGLTIRLLQTLQDADYVYIALEVTAPEGVVLSDTNLFETWDVTVGGSNDFYGSMSGGFLSGEDDEELTNQRIYRWMIHKNEAEELNGKDITMKFTNLQADAGKLDLYTVVEGQWELSWNLNIVDSKVVYNANKDIIVGGVELHVNRVEISPISYTIYYGAEGMETLMAEYPYDSGEIDYIAMMNINKIKYIDGTERTDIFGGSGSTGYTSDETAFIDTGAFSKIVDAGNIASIFIGQGEDLIEIELTK